MNNTLGMRTTLALGLLAVAIATVPAGAQEYVVEPIIDSVATQSPDEQGFTQAELDQMLAPVALYPDALLSQVLIASTYPLEIVEAARWSQQNAHLEGEAAVEAVADRGWDPSVKALVAFPDLLAQMNEDLEWTRRLGDAMLYQEPAVMDSIQFLRARADAAGSLESTEHVRVIREEKTIIIEPAETRVVYVPYYDPYIVYGTWWRPAYPPVYWARPSYYYRGDPGFYWGSGIHVSSGFFFSSFYWPHSSIVIVNTPRYYQPARYYGPTHYYAPGQRWKHNPVHRRGVAYRHPEVKQRYDSPRLKAGPVTRWPLSGSTASRAGQSTPDRRRADGARTERSWDRNTDTAARSSRNSDRAEVNRDGRTANDWRDRPASTARVQGRVQAEERSSARASGTTRASPGVRAARPSVSSTEARLRGIRDTARVQPSAAARPQPAASRTQPPVSQRQPVTSPPQRTASAATRLDPRAQPPSVQRQRPPASRAPRATSSGRPERTAAAAPVPQPRATSRGNGGATDSRAAPGNPQREARWTSAQNTRRGEPGQNGRRRD
ncbi:MAG: DUF3300 domain-containing protein [Gammaproteobacteria bacterium]